MRRRPKEASSLFFLGGDATVTTQRKESVIEWMNEFIYDNLFEPNAHWPKEEFDRKSSERWAANEIIERIKKSNDDPVLVVLYFWAEMEDYASKDEISKENAKNFKYAAEIAYEIGGMLV